MIHYLILLILLVLIALLLRLLLGLRYEGSLAMGAAVFVIAASFLLMAIAFRNLSSNLDQHTITIEDWHLMGLFDQPVTALQYDEQSGLTAILEENQTRQIGIPICMPSGKLAKAPLAAAKVMMEPYHFLLRNHSLEIPLPPKRYKQQLTFDFFYFYDIEAIASTSFVVTLDGELWCTEQYKHTGYKGAVMQTIGALSALDSSIKIFAKILVTLFVAVIAGLEIHRWRKQKQQ